MLFLLTARPGRCASITPLQSLPSPLSENKLSLPFIKKKEKKKKKGYERIFNAVPISLSVSEDILPGWLNDWFTCTSPEALSPF